MESQILDIRLDAALIPSIPEDAYLCFSNPFNAAKVNIEKALRRNEVSLSKYRAMISIFLLFIARDLLYVGMIITCGPRKKYHDA